MNEKYIERIEYRLEFFNPEHGGLKIHNLTPILDIAEIEKMLLESNLKNIYKFSINIITNTYNTESKPQPASRSGRILADMANAPGRLIDTQTVPHYFYVQDSIKTLGELHDECNRKYRIKSFAPNVSDGDYPAVITYMRDNITTGLAKTVGGIPVQTKNYWGKEILCEYLCDGDVVVNRKLKQIFPMVTGKMPDRLTELLQHGK